MIKKKQCVQSVVASLLGPEQTCAVKGQTIQSNLYLIHTIIEGVEYDKRAGLINLILSHTTGLTINNWLLSCRPPNSNPIFAGRSASHCCGTGKRKADACFCAVSVGSTRLSAVALILRFNVGAPPSQAEGQGVQSEHTWNCCPWWDAIQGFCVSR